MSLWKEKEKIHRFSESSYYSEYKRIRNKFRKYNSLKLIVGCLSYLHSPAEREEAEGQIFIHDNTCLLYQKKQGSNRLLAFIPVNIFPCYQDYPHPTGFLL